MRFPKILGIRGPGRLFAILVSVLVLSLMVEELTWLKGKQTRSDSASVPLGYRPTKRVWRQSCTKERTNFVYIKNHKSGSETLSAMFRFYGFKRQLSFVLPVEDNNNLGWPWPLDPGMYRPNKTPAYNILCEHSVYDEDFYSFLMPPDTIFTTSLREPFSRFKSAFSFFEVASYLGITSSDPVKTFLENPEKWDSLYKSKDDRPPCIPAGVSVLKNAQAFNLGFPMGFPSNSSKNRDQTNNATFVHSWLASVKTRFKFVIITEHLHESLILWRRMMCWTIGDIIYYSRNLGADVPDNETTNDYELRKNYRHWGSIDVQLYDHYNHTLWQYIAAEGPDFWQELDVFREVMYNVTSFCRSVNSVQPGQFLIIRQSRWNKELVFVEVDCNFLKQRLMPELKAYYNSIDVDVPSRQHTGPEC